MKIIPLSNNRFALVDDEDYERVRHHKWHARPTKWTIYAQTHVKRDNIDTTMQLHRLILGVDDPQIQVDHRNHNGLDCQRQNLRFATASQNSANARKAEGTLSRFKGVTWHKGTKKWAAQIILNRKRTWIGVFSTEEEAAKAYLRAAQKSFGEFAFVPNLPADGMNAQADNA